MHPTLRNPKLREIFNAMKQICQSERQIPKSSQPEMVKELDRMGICATVSQVNHIMVQSRDHAEEFGGLFSDGRKGNMRSAYQFLSIDWVPGDVPQAKVDRAHSNLLASKEMMLEWSAGNARQSAKLADATTDPVQKKVLYKNSAYYTIIHDSLRKIA